MTLLVFLRSYHFDIAGSIIPLNTILVMDQFTLKVR